MCLDLVLRMYVMLRTPCHTESVHVVWLAVFITHQVWIEPERVSSGSYISIHFPEKLLGGSLVNLGDTAMREYIIEFVSAAVEEFELDTFRTDFNIDPLPNWRLGDSALAKNLLPPTAPPVRTCPTVSTFNNSDVPAGNWGPKGTYDICEFSEAGMTAEICGAACCTVPNCSKFVFVAGSRPAPTIEGACLGKPTCNTVAGAGCCFLKGGEGLEVKPGSYTAGTVENDSLAPKTAGVSMGVTENRYNHGLWAYWDAVRHRGAELAPGFAIDNCASGGNRIDLESLVRARRFHIGIGPF
jgi:hypothetical protein